MQKEQNWTRSGRIVVSFVTFMSIIVISFLECLHFWLNANYFWLNVNYFCRFLNYCSIFYYLYELTVLEAEKLVMKKVEINRVVVEKEENIDFYSVVSIYWIEFIINLVGRELCVWERGWLFCVLLYCQKNENCGVYRRTTNVFLSGVIYHLIINFSREKIIIAGNLWVPIYFMIDLFRMCSSFIYLASCMRCNCSSLISSQNYPMN